MKAVHWVLAAALSVMVIEGKPVNCTTRTISFPLLRQHAPAAATELVPAPVPPGMLRVPVPIYNYTGPILYGVESVIYTIDVAVGLQRFNLTLDTNAQAPVLFGKGYVPPNSSCRFDYGRDPTDEDGGTPRNLFDHE
ncbi:hypothetical protein AAVH_28727 [Aphelenchoides avenae]|nr:hypothetical protein AAVH_28727 [Aphelenchus avenae]